MLTFGIVSASAEEKIKHNICTIQTYAEQAKKAGCSALCFPECFLTGYQPQNASALAVSADSPVCRQIQDLAIRLQMDLLVGFMEKEILPDEEHYFICHGLFLADGRFERYRKTHLGAREKLVFSAGNELPVFTLSSNYNIGFQICVETHFHEITQTLSLRGADLIFAPHAVPRAAGSRQKLWETYIPARSYDNRVYMACCNLWTEEKFGGGCLVTSPSGDILSSFYQDTEHMLLFSLERKNTGKQRHYFPNQRRPELYHV